LLCLKVRAASGYVVLAQIGAIQGGTLGVIDMNKRRST
jgi:hypothetical protein